MPKDTWYSLTQQAIAKLDAAIEESDIDGFPEVVTRLESSRADLQATLNELGPH